MIGRRIIWAATVVHATVTPARIVIIVVVDGRAEGNARAEGKQTNHHRATGADTAALLLLNHDGAVGTSVVARDHCVVVVVVTEPSGAVVVVVVLNTCWGSYCGM